MTALLLISFGSFAAEKQPKKDAEQNQDCTQIIRPVSHLSGSSPNCKQTDPQNIILQDIDSDEELEELEEITIF